MDGVALPEIVVRNSIGNDIGRIVRCGDALLVCDAKGIGVVLPFEAIPAFVKAIIEALIVFSVPSA